MTDVQDDDEWIYGEKDFEEETAVAEPVATEEPAVEGEGKDVTKEASPEVTIAPPVPEEGSLDPPEEVPAEAEATVIEKDKDKENEEEGDKSGDKSGDSSDEDDLTVTIGELKKAAEVMTPGQQQHQARFQPKAVPASGLKDEDFATAGKVNGVPVAEMVSSENEDKPWRKPGADLSDYFNYGFNEQTWFKYCDRQKRMRVHESGAGLSSLGFNAGKPLGHLPFSTDSQKYSQDSSMNSNGTSNGRVNRPSPMSLPPQKRTENKPEGNTIQVMTADRREYSNKVLSAPPPPFMSGPPPPIGNNNYDNMEFGGNPYMGGPDNGYYAPASYYNTPPPPSAYNPPPPTWNNPPPPIVSSQPPSVPPPPHSGSHGAPPPPRWGGDMPPTPNLNTSGSLHSTGSPAPAYRERDRDRDRDRDREVADSEEDRRRARRHRRSRSPSRSRHRTRSRSRSPGHKHKRKKSKRDRDAD